MEQVKTNTEQKLKIKEPAIYKIVFYNNNQTTMEGVILLLEQIFNYTLESAIPLMMTIHLKDQAEVWEGPEDLAYQYTQNALNYGLKAPEVLGLRFLRIEALPK